MSLFWRVCLINGAVFAAGTAILAASPATVSAPVVATEAAVLAVGLGVMLLANGALLRATLAPLDRLRHLMEGVDLLRPGQRLPDVGYGAVSDLINSFNAMIARLEAERSSSSALALAAQEGERQRVAQELHDEVGQTLTAVLLQLGRSARHAGPELGAELLETQETARESLEDVRRISRELRPEALDDLGLARALVALTERFSQSTGLEVRRELGRELPPLSEEAELVIYRVAQEALTNVARHANTGAAELSLTATDGRLTLRVLDDGIGFDPRRADGGGLRGMRERAVLVGAELTVARRSRGGTEVRLDVPISDGAP